MINNNSNGCRILKINMYDLYDVKHLELYLKTYYILIILYRICKTQNKFANN